MCNVCDQALVNLRAEAELAEVPVPFVSGFLEDGGVPESERAGKTLLILRTLVLSDGMLVCELRGELVPWPETGIAALQRLAGLDPELVDGPASDLYLVREELINP